MVWLDGPADARYPRRKLSSQTDGASGPITRSPFSGNAVGKPTDYGNLIGASVAMLATLFWKDGADSGNPAEVVYQGNWKLVLQPRG